MKKIFSLAASLLVASTAYAQLNTFREGDVISAEQMNLNFESLVNGTQTRPTTVDCGTNGSGINQAILEGYNDITIVGVCQENLNFGTATKDEQSSGNPAPKYLRLVGSDASAKILDNSNYEQSVIRVDAGTLVVENLTVEGGIYTISGNRNANVLLSEVTVQNFTERGVSINDSSYLGVDEGGLKVSTNRQPPTDMDQFGIRIITGSSGWLHTIEVSNVERGVVVYGGSMTYAYSFNIHDVETAVQVGESAFLKYGEGNSVIKNTSDKAIRVYNGTFTHWEGSLQISGLSNRALESDRANIEIEGLTVTGNPDTGEDLIAIHNSKFRIVDLALSNSGKDGLRVDGSEGQIRNATITNSQEHGLRLSAASVNLDGIIAINGSGRDGMRIEHGSAVRGGWWDPNEVGRPEYTITVTNSGRNGIEVNRNSTLVLSNFLVENSSGNGLSIGRGSVAAGGWRDEEYTTLPDHTIVIQNNLGRGVQIGENSHFEVDSIRIEGNGGKGIDIRQNSSLEGGDKNRRSDHPDHMIIVRNNGDQGIEVGDSSVLSIRNTLIENHPGPGIELSKNSILNIWNERNVAITNNGLSEEWNAPGLILEDHSIATVDGISIFNNGRGVEVRNGSIFRGGWKDQNDTSLPEYTIVIENNDYSALRVEKNSILNIENVKITNNGKVGQTNEWGTYYDDTIQISEGSTGSLNHSLIRENGGRALSVWSLSDVNFNGGSLNSSENDCIGVNKSKANFNQVPITTGGFCIDNDADVYFSESTLNITNGSIFANDSRLNMSNLILTTVGGGVSINDGSKAWFDNVTVETDQNISINNQSQLEFSNSSVTSKEYNGIDLNSGSYIGIRNSTINATEEFIDGNNNPNGSNGIDANNRSQIHFHWDNETSTTINAAAFPLKAREGSKIEIRSAIQLNSSLNWDRLQIERGSYLELSGPNEMPVQTVSSAQFEPETEIHLSDRWKIEDPGCSVQTDINGNSIYRRAVIYLNDSPTTNIGENCIIAN